MSFSSNSGGSASAGSTAPSSLFTDEEARFMRDSFQSLQKSFEPFQGGAPGFKVPSVLPPTVGGMAPFQQHHLNNSRSSLGSHSRSSSALDALMLGIGPSMSQQLPLSAPPADPYADLLHLQDTSRSGGVGHSPEAASSSSAPRVTSAPSSDPFSHLRSFSGPRPPLTSSISASGFAMQHHYQQQNQPHAGFPRDDGSMPLTSAPAESYVDLYNMRDVADQVRKQRAAAAAASAPANSGWAPPPQLIATLQQQQQRQHHHQHLHQQQQQPPAHHDPLAQSSSHSNLYQHQQGSQSQVHLGLGNLPSTSSSSATGTQATASGAYGQDKAWQMEQLNNLRLEREKWATAQQPRSAGAAGQQNGNAGPNAADPSNGHAAHGLSAAIALGGSNSSSSDEDTVMHEHENSNSLIAARAHSNPSVLSSAGPSAHGAFNILDGPSTADAVSDSQHQRHRTVSGPNHAGVAGASARQRHQSHSQPGVGRIPSGTGAQAAGPGQAPISASSPQGQPIPPAGHLSILGLSMSTSHTFPNKAAYAGATLSNGEHHPNGNGNGSIGAPGTEYAGSPASAAGGSTPGAGIGGGGFHVTASALSPQSPPGPGVPYTQGVSPGTAHHTPSPQVLGPAPGAGAGGTKRGRNSAMLIKTGIPSPAGGYYPPAPHSAGPHAESPTHVRTPGSHHDGNGNGNGNGAAMNGHASHSPVDVKGEDGGGAYGTAGRTILSLSKSRNRTASVSTANNASHAAGSGLGLGAGPSTPTLQDPNGASTGSRLASTFATRRPPLVRPPRQAIRVNVELARGKVPEQLGWAFFTADSSDRAQAHVDGIVDLRKGPAPSLDENGKPVSAGAAAGADESTASAGGGGGAANKKQKAGHVLLTEAEKKANHIASEQKRRANIRKGYEMLCDIVPPLKEALEREAAGKDGGGGGGLDEEDEDEADETGGGGGGGRGKKKRKTKKRDPDTAGCEIGGERIDGRAGPRSEAIVLMKSIEYLRDLLEIHRDLLSRRDHARHQAAQTCGVNIATYLGPAVSAPSQQQQQDAGGDGGEFDLNGDEAMQQ
ncbi:hypothetical protein OC835_000339 [Tilletia horrida]|nr:hypothetical protein OC835_000339 [Tilletia horrida]